MTTKPSNLTDLQLVLLSAAAARADGSLLPPPASVEGQLARIRKTIPPLLKRALVAEVDVTDLAQAWRDQDDRHIGLAITDLGRAAIGLGAPQSSPPLTQQDPVPGAHDAAEPEAKPRTKSAAVLDMLCREQGATLAELIAATGWLPHTIRAALTGLRKKGHAIAKGQRHDLTCYRIAEAA